MHDDNGESRLARLLAIWIFAATAIVSVGQHYIDIGTKASIGVVAAIGHAIGCESETQLAATKASRQAERIAAHAAKPAELRRRQREAARFTKVASSVAESNRAPNLVGGPEAESKARTIP